MRQKRIWTGDYHGDLGLALSHPLYIAAGRAVTALSKDNLPLILNCFSGMGMAVALGNLAVIVTLLTRRRWIGLLTAATLAVAHAPWWLSTITEVYTWSLAGLTAELLLLIMLLQKPRPMTLAMLGLISGLGLCVHNLALLPLPIYGIAAIVLAWKKKLPLWSLAMGLACWLVGAGLYLGMTVQTAVDTGDWGAAILSALFGNYREEVLNVQQVSSYFKANMALSAMNFASLLLPLAAVGWILAFRKLDKSIMLALLGVTLMQFGFYVRYPIPDQFTFILPSLVMIAIAAGLGLSLLAAKSQTWCKIAIVACVLSIIAQPVFYAAAPSLAKRFVGDIRPNRKLPFRDEAVYWLTPWKHNEQSAEDFARAAILKAGPDGVIVTDRTTFSPLWLSRELDTGARDIGIQFQEKPLPQYDDDPEAFRKALGDRQLYYVLKPATGNILNDAGFIQDSTSLLYKVTWKDLSKP